MGYISEEYYAKAKGEGNPHWKGGVTHHPAICLNCGKEFLTYNSKMCGRVCFGKRHSKIIKGTRIDNKHPLWKGDNVGYSSLHRWIRKRKPKPAFCEECNTCPPLDVANISQQYKRDINDFEWLCRSCHINKDGRNKPDHRNATRRVGGTIKTTFKKDPVEVKL